VGNECGTIQDHYCQDAVTHDINCPELLASGLRSRRSRERHVLLPPGRWHVDVLDTWECTVDRLPGVHETFVLVPLPSKPYQPVRLVAA
jgi:hypothetical protein